MSRGEKRCLRYSERGVTTGGIIVTCAVAVVCGGGMWLLSQILTSGQDSGAGEAVALFSLSCDNMENLAQILEITPETRHRDAGKSQTDPDMAGYDNLWKGDISKALREDVFSADFNGDGDTEDTIKTSASKKGGVYIQRGQPAARLSGVSAERMIVFFPPPTTAVPSASENIYYIGKNRQKGCWGWNHDSS